jgi:hypothetical protein
MVLQDGREGNDALGQEGKPRAADASDDHAPSPPIFLDVLFRAVGIVGTAEVGMRKSVQFAMWAVYQMTFQGQPGPKVVCLQTEWDVIEKATPGLHRLIRGGILNEGEAERLARGTSGDDPVRVSRKKPIAEVLDPEPDFIVESAGERGQEDTGPLLLPFPVLAKEARQVDAADEPPGKLSVRCDGEVA